MNRNNHDDNDGTVEGKKWEIQKKNGTSEQKTVPRSRWCWMFGGGAGGAGGVGGGDRSCRHEC